MKKLVFVLAVLAAMTMSACCGTETAPAEQVNDSTAMVADSVCECADSVAGDSVK